MINFLFKLLKWSQKVDEVVLKFFLYIILIGLIIYGGAIVLGIAVFMWIIRFIIWIFKRCASSSKKKINNKINDYEDDNKEIEWEYKKIRDYGVKKRSDYEIEFYVNKKYRFLLNNDEMNYRVLGLNNNYQYNVTLEDKEGAEYYFIDDTDSLEYYGELFLKLFKYCHNEIRIVISSDNKVLYEFYSDGKKIRLNGYGDTSIRNMYYRYINFIREFDYRLSDGALTDCNSIWKVFDDIGVDSFEYDKIIKKVDKSKVIDIFELPYIKELWLVAKKLEPIVDKEDALLTKEIRDTFGGYEEIQEVVEEKPKKVKKDKKKEEVKKLSWEEEEFEREAELWGLSEEDKMIAKAEGFTPADFVEAEERMDDILDTDEWEDKKK